MTAVFDLETGGGAKMRYHGRQVMARNGEVDEKYVGQKLREPPRQGSCCQETLISPPHGLLLFQTSLSETVIMLQASQ